MVLKYAYIDIAKWDRIYMGNGDATRWGKRPDDLDNIDPQSGRIRQSEVSMRSRWNHICVYEW